MATIRPITADISVHDVHSIKIAQQTQQGVANLNMCLIRQDGSTIHINCFSPRLPGVAWPAWLDTDRHHITSAEFVARTSTPPPTDAEQYLKGQEACGIKKGDWVKVLRIPSAKDERGWRRCWQGRMDKFVGQACQVTEVCDTDGFRLATDDTNLYFPYTVLRKVPAPEPEVVYYARDEEEANYTRVWFYRKRPVMHSWGEWITSSEDGFFKSYTIPDFARIFGFTPGYGDCRSITRERYDELTSK